MGGTLAYRAAELHWRRGWLPALAVCLFLGTTTARIIGVSPHGSPLRLEVPLSIAPAKRVLTGRRIPCMEKTNHMQAVKSHELLLKLLDAVNSEEEHRYLRDQLALVEALLGGAFPKNQKEVQTTWKVQ